MKNGLFNWIPGAAKARWGGITKAPPTVPCVFRAFESIAVRHRSKTALRYQGRSLSYRELLLESNKIAARLHCAGSGLPGRVALFFEDRIRAVTAILGALRAGHAFVILDPGDPPSRIQHILRDCAPLALLTDTENFYQLEGLIPEGCRRINIEEPMTDSPPPPACAVQGDGTAYICYTSGSTGKPKGVRQSRANLLYFVHHYAAALNIRPGDRLSLLFSLSFSAANMDIFGGLLNGATVCAYDMRKDGVPGLADWLEQEAVSVLHAVPTIFRRLAALLPEGRILSCVRAIDLGGETVTARDMALWRDHFPPHSECWNHLAATEASVIAQCRMDRSMAGHTGLLPVGTSPAGLEVRIVREDGTRAAEEEPGRIVLISRHLSPGYWRQPESNACHFADEPGRPGWRVFRGGDTGYLGSNGLLYFQGRLGTRVKIRGLSVDLAEVEAALRSGPGVREAAVVALPDETGKEAGLLTAHLVMEAEAAGDPVRMRGHLATLLPGYMIPTAFAFHKALPQTSSGKLDRLALARLPRMDADVIHVPPANEWEQKVADAFTSVLGAGPVGGTGDFFLLGGDSISAVNLLNTLAGLLGMDVPHIVLLENTTVRGLAAALEKLAASASPATKGSPLLVPIQTRGSRPILFLTHGRLGQAHASPRFIQLLGEDQPVYGIQARGLDGRDNPHISLEDMARDYVAAIRAIQDKGPYFLGGLCAGSYITLLMASLLRQSGEEVLPLLLLDPAPPPFRKPKDLIPGSQGENRVARAIDQRLHQRAHQGHIQANLGNPKRRQAAIEVVMAFERALSVFTPTPCDHPVYMLTSKLRTTPDKWGSPSVRKSCFSGDLKILEVAGRHDEIFDVRNPDFAAHLKICLEAIRGGARAPGVATGADL